MARDEYVVLLDNRIRFTTSKPVAVEDVVASLRGMDYIVRHHFAKAIKNLTDAKVESVELLVTGLEDGSLVEDTAIKLIFGSQEQYDKFVGCFRDKFVSKNDKGETVVKGWVAGSLLAGIALVGFLYYQQLNKAPAPGGLISVNGDSNVVVTIGAEAYNTNPQEFQKVLEKVVPRTKPEATAKAGAQFLAPARAEDGAAVELESDNQRTQVLSPSTVRKVPRIEREDTSQDSSFSNVTLHLRASDTDSGSRGWAGTIDRLAERRTRVIFANPSDSGKALFKPEIRADVTITYADSTHAKAVLIIVEKVY